jgi:hypothetical protein
MKNEDFKPAIEDYTKMYYNGALIKRQQHECKQRFIDQYSISLNRKEAIVITNIL